MLLTASADVIFLHYNGRSDINRSLVKDTEAERHQFNCSFKNLLAIVVWSLSTHSGLRPQQDLHINSADQTTTLHF